jgi:hypothetical protein
LLSWKVNQDESCNTLVAALIMAAAADAVEDELPRMLHQLEVLKAARVAKLHELLRELGDKREAPELTNARAAAVQRFERFEDLEQQCSALQEFSASDCSPAVQILTARVKALARQEEYLKVHACACSTTFHVSYATCYNFEIHSVLID